MTDRHATADGTLVQVLELMKEVTEEEEAAGSSDSNGYHSDSDNAVSV